eukprot:TRINITY_DN5414_c0_g1_i1.p1 TRINITY_DN5414_c0_g1~~TRINITY_DN5414_c0_g1_i1.p1  ORF type:complete len:161 (-),score=33.30 TRINITY_DN5414_c0_g1_i1:279-761(-)
MIRQPPRSTLSSSSAASDVYKRQYQRRVREPVFAGKWRAGGSSADCRVSLTQEPNIMVCPYRVAVVAGSALLALIGLWFYNKMDDEEEEEPTTPKDGDDDDAPSGWSASSVIFYIGVAAAHVVLLTSLGGAMLEACGLQWAPGYVSGWWADMVRELDTEW